MGVRYGNLGIATAANPRIETGGLCGESKASILDMAGKYASESIARYAVFPSGLHAYASAMQLIKELDLSFPVVIKPDIGCNGTGVKCIASAEQLADILPLYPAQINLMVQELITHTVEVGIFYIRHPGSARGEITSLTYKTSPTLVGDGVSTLKSLLQQRTDLSHAADLYFKRISKKEDLILKKDEVFPLVFTGNYCKGSVFHDGKKDITSELVTSIDKILQDVPDFYFGRIDAKVPSIDDLKKGKDIRIIEINGLGAEAIHIWDPKTSLLEAYKTQIKHYGAAFRIGADNRKRGWKPSSLLTMLRAWLRHRHLLSAYPMSD
ncbi:D-alanine--D-alanine ligase [Neokomagataea thailandica NBRC 106555]|uniref:D-alanine--D-alanine ligase n=2 Tax=Neokomagataea thailandica TaxID=661190 RepID=A0ABQ0QRQ2_9PROT|nr:D-alanine--D-alanine ligase [Neokomagataea thailandica NBRC 106555]